MGQMAYVKEISAIKFYWTAAQRANDLSNKSKNNFIAMKIYVNKWSTVAGSFLRHMRPKLR